MTQRIYAFDSVWTGIINTENVYIFAWFSCFYCWNPAVKSKAKGCRASCHHPVMFSTHVPTPVHHFCLLPALHFSLLLFLLYIHQDGNGQASWLRLNRHTYRRALPEHLSFSPSGWGVRPVCSVAGAPPRSLVEYTLSSAVAANMRVCKGISAYLFQSLLAIKSGDGRKGPVCSPVPQRSPDGLLYELAMSCIIPGSPFHSHPAPIHTPFQTWKRIKRRVACRRLFVPVCWDKWPKKKKGVQTSSPQGLRGLLWFVPPDYMKWLNVHGGDGSCLPGDGQRGSPNLQHVSRICHFLQAHKRKSELLALITCFPMPFVAAEFHRLSLESKKSEWHQFYLTCLKALFLIRSMVIWDSGSKRLCHISYDSRRAKDSLCHYHWVLLNIHSSHWHIILYKNFECFQTE